MSLRETDVCVVGAGLAGLAAARALSAAGREVVVLEARDRVGGRIWNRRLEDGTVLSVGGTWLGRGQDRMFALCREFGIETYPQDHDGARILTLGDTNHRYSGSFPRIGVFALASLGVAFKRLERMTRQLPLDKPWEAPGAESMDSRTLGEWISARTNVASADARALLETTMTLLFCCDPAEVSLLGALVLARGGDGFEYYVDSKQTETHLVDGGVPEVANRMAEVFGDAICLGTPVRRIAQSEGAVTVEADSLTVSARRVIVAAPPLLASRILYEPALPAASSHLLQRMTSGSMIRVHTVYAEPFWRRDGLTGESAATPSPLPVSIDQTPKSGSPGVLSSYAFGPGAVAAASLATAARRSLFLEALAKRFGAAAASPVAYLETDWQAEPWSLGGMISHFAPGVLTSYGRALREPAGRIHWAGSERATRMHGLMEGAVLSGERAAAEVLESP